MELTLRYGKGNGISWFFIEKIQKVMAAVYTVAVIPFKRTAVERTEVNQRAERLMSVYGNAILRVAYSYVHNMEDAEEVLQETLIKILEVNPNFENESHEKSYLLKIAANLSKNRIRYNKYRETDELSEELVAEEREDLSFVWEAVKSLPDTSRDVLHLFYYEGYQVADIARILCRKEATVRSDLKRARERLKTMLREEYDFEEV